MRILLNIILILNFLNFAIATRRPSSEESKGLSTVDQGRLPSGRKKRGYEYMRNEKIVQILSTPNNGISTYREAKENANHYIRHLREKNKQHCRDYRKEQTKQEKANPRGQSERVRYNKVIGYHSKESTIERRTRTFMKSDSDLSEEVAMEMAIKAQKEKQDKKNEYRRQRRLKERMKNRPDSIGIKVKNPGKYTKEARINRKIDALLQKPGNGIETRDQAKELAEKHVTDEYIRKNNHQKEQLQRLKKSLKNVP